jgi:hypothetical protein
VSNYLRLKQFKIFYCKLNYSVRAGILIGNRNGMEHLEDLGVDGDNSKMIVREIELVDVVWVQLRGVRDYIDEYLHYCLVCYDAL